MTQLLFVILLIWKIWQKNADGHKYRHMLGMSKGLHFTWYFTEVVYTASCLHLSHHCFCRICWRRSNLMEERCCNIRWRTCKNYVGKNMMMLWTAVGCKHTAWWVTVQSLRGQVLHVSVMFWTNYLSYFIPQFKLRKHVV